MHTSSFPHSRERTLKSRALGKTMSSLAQSPALRELFMYVRDQVWQVMTPDESSILRSHFPPQNGGDGFALLPLTGMVALRMLMNNEYNIDCLVGEAIFPGENLKIEREQISILTPVGQPLIAIKFKRWTSESGKIGQGFTVPINTHMTEYSEFTLPQGEGFRFVNGVSVSENGEYFSGRYDLTSNFDIALLPELVAQMGLAAGSASKKLKPGELCFYKGGRFNFATHIDLEGVTSLHLSAKVIPGGTKRDVSYIFSLRTDTGIEIFWGQVDGTRVKYTTLVEGLKKSKESREKVGEEN